MKELATTQKAIDDDTKRWLNLVKRLADLEDRVTRSMLVGGLFGGGCLGQSLGSAGRGHSVIHPDAVLTMEHVEQRNETKRDVDLIATGTHSGPLDLGAFGLLKPTGIRLALRLWELLDIRDGHITYTSLSFDINGLMRQLNRSDYDRLPACLESIRQLAAELAVLGADRI